MNAHAALLAPPQQTDWDTEVVVPLRADMTAEASPPQVSSRYGEGRRPNVGAALASVGIVAGLLSLLVTMDVVTLHKKKMPQLAVFDLKVEPPPPPPPPTPVTTSPTPARAVPTEVVAPTPLVQVATDNVQIATVTTPPPPQATVVGPPAPPAPVASTGPADAGDLSSKMVAADPPRYPLDSRRKREQGTVVLQVLLSADGRVASVSVSQSSGFERLDKAALDAVRRWRWSPTIRDGQAVMVTGRVRIPFLIRTEER
ncbi:energy transducer TonB [Sphingomonas aquatilis]|uniref:energy transducer TonB n=1 Tax=Sphingomonas aquatilis TaxID=93063 RepID=UPI0023F825D5|nr:energy transducer TonB [Sphingomonas aquatilis]MCI4654024.1 energy transducer TonB [Sphingomonas aquatilis]